MRFRRLAAVAAAAALMISFSGCSLFSADALYCLPDASESYYNLQEALRRVTDGGYSYLSPGGGAHQEAAELVDLDGDGVDEAVAFFSGSDGSVLACVFSEQDGAYRESARFSCAGSGITAVDYNDLNQDGRLELLMCCSVADNAPQVLQVFSPASGAVLLETVCSRYVLMDLDDSGRESLICLSESDTGAEAVCWSADHGTLSARGTARLGASMTDLTQASVGRLLDGSRALLVSFVAEGNSLTDVLVLHAGSLRAVHSESGAFGISGAPELLLPSDINDDGYTEFPAVVRLDAYSEDAPEQAVVQWKHMDMSGEALVCGTSYYSSTGSWSLVVPELWATEISALESNGTAGDGLVNRVEFYRSDGANRPGEAQLSIYSISGDNCLAYAEENGLTVLYSGTRSVIAVSINENAETWDGTMSLSQLSDGLTVVTENET